MLAIDQETTATIPATKSHKARKVVHTPNTTGSGPHSGTVTVTEHTGVRVQRVLTDTYLIDEQPEVGFSGRLFLILKDHTNGANADTVKGQKDAERVGNVYECRVSGDFGSCTCDGFTASVGRNKCVHLLAMQALIAAGLPHPQNCPEQPSDDDTQEIEIVPVETDMSTESDGPTNFACEGTGKPLDPKADCLLCEWPLVGPGRMRCTCGEIPPVDDWRVGPRNPVTGRPAYVIPPDQDVF